MVRVGAEPEESVVERGGDGRCECFERAERLGRRLRLHPGAMYLYRRDGEWRVLADIDHVYHRCEAGLMRNIRELKRLLDPAAPLVGALAIGKAYDDDIYLFTTRRREPARWPRGLEGLRVAVIEADPDYVEKNSSHMELASPDIIRKALHDI